LEAGQVFKSPGRTLTEGDHALFMMLCGDWHPIHADEEFAKTSTFGRRVMHGSFGITLALGLQTRALEYSDKIIGAMGLKDWRFCKPLFIGDTVHVEIEIMGKRETSKKGRVIAERALRLIKHDASVIQEGRSDIMLLTE
jgi:acyl dehydratase